MACIKEMVVEILGATKRKDRDGGRGEGRQTDSELVFQIRISVLPAD